MGQKKGGRGRAGGRRHFVTSAEDLEKRNATLAESQKQRASRRGDEDEDDDDEEVEEADDESRRLEMEKLREEVKDIEATTQKAKKKGAEGVISTANPNAANLAQKHKKAKDLADDDDDGPRLTRREREEMEKQRAAEAYRKRHAEGKTDEYKADMERLQAARKRREEEAEKRKSDEEVARRAEAAAAAAGGGDDDDEDKLDARTVKALKPAQLKEHLKARGLSTQGQKKDLVDRLLAAIS